MTRRGGIAAALHGEAAGCRPGRAWFGGLALRRTAAIAACALAVDGFVGCTRSLVSGPDTGPGLRDFEMAWSFVDSLYPMLDGKGVDWDSVRAALLPRAEATSEGDILPVLVEMLGRLSEAHAYVKSAGGAVVYPHLPRRLLRDKHSFSPYLVRRYLVGPMRLAGGEKVEYGMLENNLGYLRLPTFDPNHMLDDFSQVMAFLESSDGLVIDIRNNNGGSRGNATRVVSRFLDAPLTYLLAFERDGVPRYVDPPVSPDPAHRYRKPVVVLINGAAVSAGDIFAEFMGALPNVTLVGDTTAGAACQDRDGLLGDLRLPGGALVHLPTRCALRFDGVPLEWYGVPPDVRVTQTEADVRAGRDPQLERAIALLGG